MRNTEMNKNKNMIIKRTEQTCKISKTRCKNQKNSGNEQHMAEARNNHKKNTNKTERFILNRLQDLYLIACNHDTNATQVLIPLS